jgi:hypothetical protein
LLLRLFESSFTKWWDCSLYFKELFNGLFGLKEMPLSLTMSGGLSKRFKILFGKTFLIKEKLLKIYSYD